MKLRILAASMLLQFALCAGIPAHPLHLLTEILQNFIFFLGLAVLGLLVYLYMTQPPPSSTYGEFNEEPHPALKGGLKEGESGEIISPTKHTSPGFAISDVEVGFEPKDDPQ